MQFTSMIERKFLSCRRRRCFEIQLTRKGRDQANDVIETQYCRGN